MDDPDSLRLVKECRENIGKVCRVFFHYGSIGDLSPLSTRFISGFSLTVWKGKLDADLFLVGLRHS